MPNFSIYCCCDTNPAILWVGTQSGVAANCGVVALDSAVQPIWQFRTNGVVARPTVGNSWGRMCRSDGFLYVPFQRNTSWEGSDGSNKSVAVLDLQTGIPSFMIDTGSIANTTAVTPSGQFVVAGTRNNAWPGSGGAQASVFFYDTDGTLLWTYDTGTTALTATIDDDGNVVVGGVFNSTTNVHLWRLQASDGSLLASIRLDIQNGNVVSVDSGPGATICCVRPSSAPNNDIFQLPANLSGVTSSAQKFNGNFAPTAAINTSPFSWISSNFAGTAMQIESGTELQSIATGLANPTNVCRTTVSALPECWVSSLIIVLGANNLAKVTGATMDTATPYRVTFSGNNVNLTTVIQEKFWHG